MTIDSLRDRYEAADQGHLLTFWSNLSKTEQADLTTQLQALDIERVNRIYKKAMDAANPGTVTESIEPLPKEATDSAGSPERDEEWRRIGLEAVSRCQVAVLLMAGGQGTRLGSSAPKGCYDIGLPSHKSLFQYQGERIARLQTLAEQESGKPAGSVIIPWYVMTSGPTRRATEEFFQKHAFFSLHAENVVFFEQGNGIQCDYRKIIQYRRRNVALSHDGRQGHFGSPISDCGCTGRKRRAVCGHQVSTL